MKNCKRCGAQNKTIYRTFCSSKCANNFDRIKPDRLSKMDHPCKYCGGKTAYRRTTCDSCKYKGRVNLSDTLQDLVYTQHGTASAFARVRSRARVVIKDELKVCERCGYDKHIEVCHVRPVSDFPMTTLVTEINSRENLKILCPNCHWELDNGLWYSETGSNCRPAI